MSHIPVNHHLRPVYRVLAVLIGAVLLVSGAVGWQQTAGSDWSGVGDWTALGLPTNRALAVASLAVGLLVLGAALVGRNVDRFVNLWAGGALLVAGTGMMPLSHTESNVLNSSIGTAIAAYVIGTLLVAAGLYGKVGPAGATGAEDVAGARADKELTSAA